MYKERKLDIWKAAWFRKHRSSSPARVNQESSSSQVQIFKLIWCLRGQFILPRFYKASNDVPCMLINLPAKVNICSSIAHFKYNEFLSNTDLDSDFVFINGILKY